MKKYITFALILTSLLASSFTFSSAQVAVATLSDDVADQTEIECTTLTFNLSLGSRDSKTKGQVTALQIFLSQAGYLESDPTGYFGQATKNAVKKFQTANGISALGGVGAYTRTKINSISCSASTVVSTPKAAVGNPTTYAPTEVKVLNASGFAAYSVSPNTSSVKIGSFTLTSGNGAYLNNIELFIGVSGYNISNITNLTIKSNGVVVGNSIGNVTSDNVFSFPALIIEKGAMKTFDVYADLGSGAGAVSVKASFSGTTGGGNSFSVLNDKFIPITTTSKEVSASAEVSAKLVAASSPFSQSVSGGQEFFIATFNIRPKNSGAVKIKDLHFEIAGDDTIQTVTAYGQTAVVVGGKVSLYDINVLAPESGVDIPVSVKFNSVDSNFTTVLGYGATVTSSYTTSLILNKITAINNSGYVTESNVSASSNKMKVVFGNSNATTTPQKGSYRGYLNGSKTPFIATDNITKEEAYTNCKTNASNNPTSSIVCTWNGVEIYLLNPINKVSTVPTVEFLSTPTLKLQYDSANKESMLTGKTKVKVTTGNTPITTYRNYIAGTLRFSFNNNGAYFYTRGMSYLADNSSFSGDPLQIPANTSVIFDVTSTAKTGEMFPGSYTLSPQQFYYTDSTDLNTAFKSIQPSAFKTASVSNSVTIIGETSPYITGITFTQVAGGIMEGSSAIGSIQGSHFDPTNNQLTINGITKQAVAPNKSIIFSPKDFNITTSGTYNVQVSVNGQASNNFGISLSAPVTTISAPTVEILSTPTLKLQYDSANKESVITGEVSFKITTGASAISLSTDSNGNPSTYLYGLSNNSSNTFVGLNSGKLVTTTSSKNPATIPANTSVTFTTTYTAKPGDLFAGSYILRPTEMYYWDQNGIVSSVPLSSYKNLSLFKHNPVTVVGENAIAATITGFGNKDPNPTTGETMLLWNTSKPTQVMLSVTCFSDTVSFSTDSGRNVFCNKSGQTGTYSSQIGVSSGVFVVTPTGNTTPVTISFTLTILDKNGSPTERKDALSITFPAVSKPAKPVVTFWSDATSVAYGGDTILRWSSVGSDETTKSCYIQGGVMSGTTYATAYIKTQPLTATQTFSLYCTGKGGQSDTKTVTITVLPQPAPVYVPPAPTENYWEQQVPTNLDPCGGGGCGASLVLKNTLSQVSKTILNAGQVAVSALSGATQASAAECVSITRNIHRGDESSTTKKLQEFLIAKGLLSEKATGFFGDLTIEAVKAYQRSLGVKETGMVYDVTRQAIMTETCQ